MAGSVIAMRPINNASPIYSAWSSARWRAMTEWREQWLPQSMAGGRPNKEASDVTLEHALAMELAVMQNRSVGAMALDWAKFFDSINRDIRDALMKKIDDTRFLCSSQQLRQCRKPFWSSSKIQIQNWQGNNSSEQDERRRIFSRSQLQHSGGAGLHVCVDTTFGE